MARIDALPSLEIIRGLKGILDFYLWRGLPCVRAWPKYRPVNQTAASLAAALIFGAIVKAYSLVGEDALSAYRELAVGIPRTARDLMVSGVYGNLHEASMGDFLDLLTQARDFLSDLTALLSALHSIDTDEIVVRVEHSVLPDGAASAAAQANQLTALQKIDDLQDALESKALDRLLVRGMDQVFTVQQPLLSHRLMNIDGADGKIPSHTPDSADVWVVTNAWAKNSTSPTTGLLFRMLRGGVWSYCFEERRAIAAGEWVGGPIPLIMFHLDKLYAYFPGGQVNDSCELDLTGYKMTLET